jgi:hypothetical protein
MIRYKSLAFLVLLMGVPLAGCNDILSVTDPDIIIEANSASAALALKNGVLLRLAQALNGVQGPDAFFVYSGLVTDEWRSGDTFVQRNNQDQRIWEPTNTFNADPYRRLNRVRIEGQAAIKALRQYLPDSLSLVARILALKAYVETLIAENYCNGTPLSELDGTAIVYGQPLSNDSVLALAIQNADSALAQAALAPPGDSIQARRATRLARVVKGRALVDRGQFAAAAAAVAGVPDTFRYQITHSVNANTNQIFALNNSARRYTMVDTEGVVGLNFISANDPRLPRATGTNPSTDLIFDSAFPLFVTRQGIWSSTGSVSIVTGIEARLIEAEALLQASNTAGWLAAINALRTNTALYPTALTGFTRGPNLTAIADTFASNTSRMKTNFRERAFWMFSTGHRLGDMRRMVRQYAYPADSIYPRGSYYKGGTFGTALMLPVPFEEVNNPNFTACTNLDP